VGNTVKALICKALKTLDGICQQSYPQKSWTLKKAFMNQRLKAFSAALHELGAAQQPWS
jgi:hypothetical protein